MFVIVKNAGPECIERWEGNPTDGVHPSFSCHDTFTGQDLGIRPVYTDKDEAEIDCQRANHSNPSGYYAVCPVLESEVTPMIRDTAENWEDGTLGRDAAFVRVVPESELQDINEALGLEVVELRLEKEVVEEFKRVAEAKGVGYKTLMRVALKVLAATGNFTF